LLFLHIFYGDANFMKVSFCLHLCHAPLRMPETRPIKPCPLLYVSNARRLVHKAYMPKCEQLDVDVDFPQLVFFRAICG